jgi:signal transduction histidine kinase
MLDLSRLEAGQFPLRSDAVNLTDILEEVRQQVTPQAAAKGLRLRIDPPGELLSILGDELGIYQILLNLVGNAVKFTETGEVHLQATAVGSEVVITVRDTGIGIASEDLAQIFKPFRQAGRGMTRRYEGAGLGLAIVQQLVDQQGGRIHVTSQLGEGSTFTVTLPVAPLPSL